METRLLSFAVIIAVVITSLALFLGGCAVTEKNKTLSGMRVSDIQQRLQNDWNMQFKPAKLDGNDYSLHGLRVVQPGVYLKCMIIFYSDNEISHIDYDVTWFEARKHVDKKYVQKLAKQYLSYCAAIPCKGVDAKRVVKAVSLGLAKSEIKSDSQVGQAKISIANYPKDYIAALLIDPAK